MLTPSPIHKKAYPLHHDLGQYFADVEAIKAEVEKGQDMESVLAGMDSAFYPKPAMKRYYRRHKFQFNDPIGLLYVVDMLIWQQRGTYIRPHYISSVLAPQQPLYFWENRALGRALSGLATACWEEYRQEGGAALDEREVPFSRGRDAKGAYYAMDPKGGNEGLFWLMNVRKVLLGLAGKVMHAEQSGNFEFTLGNKADVGYSQNLAQPADLYAEWFEGTRVRTTEQYLAQCDEQPFFRAKTRNISYDSDPLA